MMSVCYKCHVGSDAKVISTRSFYNLGGMLEVKVGKQVVFPAAGASASNKVHTSKQTWSATHSRLSSIIL